MKFVLRLGVARAQSAMSPRSPVRTRIASSTGITNILPSPMLPVPAASMMALMAVSTASSLHHHLELHLGQQVHDDGLAAAALVGDAPLGPTAR